MDVGQILTVTANKFPGRTAVISGDRRFTYQQFNERVNRFAHGLLKLGFKKGDKVAVLLFNSNPFAEVYFATAKLGGACTPINYRFAPEEVKHILNHSDSRFFIFGEEFTELVKTIRPHLKKVKTFISAGGHKTRNALHYEALLKRSRKDEPGVTLSENDVCQLMYTSGTTGRPKGALITHGNVLWNLVNTILGREDKEGEVALIIGPLYHTAALNNHFTIQVALAGTSVLIKKFEPKDVMEIIQREKVNVISGAPAMFHRLLTLPNVDDYDTRSITKCTAGAAILPDETKKRLLRLFPNAEGVYDVYGCTEASPDIAILKAKDSLRKRACVGPPLPFLEIRIVDDRDRDVTVGKVGELICRGPNVMKGYYKDKKATLDTLKGGWLHTGDLARIDNEGFIYIVDRKKDMIVSGGENIYPREIEEVLYHHPKIEDVAVIGVPDSIWGESVKAFIVLTRGETLTAEEVIEYCKQRLASYKKPKTAEFVETLPRNPSGKVLKTVLREREGKRNTED